MGKDRQPVRGATPPTGKQPRIEAEPQYEGTRPLWSFEQMDAAGPWCIEAADGGYFQKALKRLATLETMTWHEILSDQKRNHLVPPGRLCSQAQSRLRHIQLDDLENLVSLTIEGKPRIWGIRDRGVFRVLWWDPEHSVCPSHKKHT